MAADLPTNSLGHRLRALRERADLSLGELAEATGVSKSYLWNLENKPEHQRPSGETLYEIARVLETTMSELLGRELLTEPKDEVDSNLRQFADEHGVPEEDVRMLASIRFRGGPPKTVERWRFIYDALTTSSALDRNSVRGRGRGGR